MDEEERRRRLAQRSPAQIDAKLFELIKALTKAQQDLKYSRARRSRSDIVAAKAVISRLERQMDMLDEEWARRPWSRFFVVRNNNGHIHSNRECSTCFPTTSWGWLPNLSGKTEADAVYSEGPNLCSICFPSAPVEWTQGDKGLKPEHCLGSEGSPVEGTVIDRTRYAVNNGFYGDCPVCGKRAVKLKAGSKLSRHKPKDEGGKPKQAKPKGRTEKEFPYQMTRIDEIEAGNRVIIDGIRYTVDSNVKIPGIDIWSLRLHETREDDARVYRDERCTSEMWFLKEMS